MPFLSLNCWISERRWGFRRQNKQACLAYQTTCVAYLHVLITGWADVWNICLCRISLNIYLHENIDILFRWHNTLYINTYVIQKVSSDGLLENNKNLFPNHLYGHLMYMPYATFRHSFHHCWGICHSRAQVLYPCIVEWCRLRCKPRVNGFFNLVVVVEPAATKESYQM
jgi:hypothetical protein